MPSKHKKNPTKNGPRKKRNRKPQSNIIKFKGYKAMKAYAQPTTSQQVKRSHFKKFGQNSYPTTKQRIANRERRLNSIQLAKRRLVRSANRCERRKQEKLQMQLRKMQEMQAAERTRLNSTDDDCVCLEPPIEHITISDDSICDDAGQARASKVVLSKSPTVGNSPSGGYESILEYLTNRNATGTSTPCAKSQSGYYDDISKTPWFETTLQSDDVVFVNESTLKPDDSVIFVGETRSSSPDFIPLSNPHLTPQFPVPCTPNPGKKHYTNSLNNLFTAREQKQLKQFNQNLYSGNVIASNAKRRMVIIDGSNVAYGHGLNAGFSVKGLQICIQYFEQMQHEVKAVVPQFRLSPHKSTDPNTLDRLHREGKIVFTPCKKLPGKSSISYDDRFILQLAAELDAAVVSNDNYRDLMNENPAFKKIVENRVIGYTWCDDIFILPTDPYGRWGPSLHSILNRD